MLLVDGSSRGTLVFMVMGVEGVTCYGDISGCRFPVHTKFESVAFSLFVLILISRKLIDCCPVSRIRFILFVWWDID